MNFSGLNSKLLVLHEGGPFLEKYFKEPKICTVFFTIHHRHQKTKKFQQRKQKFPKQISSAGQTVGRNILRNRCFCSLPLKHRAASQVGKAYNEKVRRENMARRCLTFNQCSFFSIEVSLRVTYILLFVKLVYRNHRVHFFLGSNEI